MAFKNVRLSWADGSSLGGPPVATLYRKPGIEGSTVCNDDALAGKHGSVTRPLLGRELVSGTNYRIDLLPSQPSVLNAERYANIAAVRADLDTSTGYATIASDLHCFVWNYNSPDLSPNTLSFDSTGESLSRIIPSSSYLEPGLVKVDLVSGAVTVWWSVGRALAEALIPHKNHIEGTISLLAGERVVAAEYIYPSGLIVATSFARYALVTLRNASGKPQVSVQYVSPRTSLLGIKTRLLSSRADLGHVNIRAGQATEANNVVYICSSRGDLSVWNCAVNGDMDLLHRGQLVKLIYEYVWRLYTGVKDAMLVNDIAIDDEVLYALISFQHHGKPKWLLATLTLPDFTVVSAYRLQRYEETATSPARLLLKGPILYAVMHNAVVLLDSQPTRGETRFEEAIFFQSNLTVFTAKVHPQYVLILTSAGVVRIQAYDNLRVPEPAEKLKQLLSLVEDSSPLDYVPRQPLGTPNEVEAAVVQILKIQSREPAAKRHELIQKLIKVIDVSPAPEGAAYPVGIDTRWAMVEAAALYAAVAAVSSSIDSPQTDQILPGFLVLLKTDPTEAAQGLLAAITVIDTAPLSSEFPSHCPWPASPALGREIEIALRNSQSPQVRISLTEVLCWSLMKRSKYLAATGQTDFLTALESAMNEALGSLARISLDDSVRIPERLKSMTSLATLLADRYATERSRDLVSKLDYFIQKYGETFIGPLFDRFWEKQAQGLLYEAFSERHSDLLSEYFRANARYQYEWALMCTQEDFEGAAKAIELAEPQILKNKLHTVKLMTSLQKLTALVSGSNEAVTSANSKLELSEVQEQLMSQYKEIGEALRTETEVVQKILATLLLKAETQLLSGNELADSLTYMPIGSEKSALNYAHGLQLSSDLSRKKLLVQQVILNTNWSRLHENLTHSVLFKTLKMAPNEARALLDPKNWEAPVERDFLQRLYPWATLSVIDDLSNFLISKNSQVARLCESTDIQAIMQNVYEGVVQN